MQKVFYGKEEKSRELKDLELREKLILVPLVLIIIWLGLFPQPVLNTVKQPTDVRESVKQTLRVQEHHISTVVTQKGNNHE